MRENISATIFLPKYSKGGPCCDIYATVVLLFSIFLKFASDCRWDPRIMSCDFTMQNPWLTSILPQYSSTSKFHTLWMCRVINQTKLWRKLSCMIKYQPSNKSFAVVLLLPFHPPDFHGLPLFLFSLFFK
jgi:hypothetical protein